MLKLCKNLKLFMILSILITGAVLISGCTEELKVNDTENTGASDENTHAEEAAEEDTHAVEAVEHHWGYEALSLLGDYLLESFSPDFQREPIASVLDSSPTDSKHTAEKERVMRNKRSRT